MQIIPTTGLQKDFREAERRVQLLTATSKWIQIDVCDNVFAPGKTFELELINKFDIQTDKLLWDIHLMVREPIDWLNKCVFIGAARVTGEVELMTDRERFVTEVKNEGLEAGLAFNIETLIDNIPAETDMVILMGRQAGFGQYPIDKKIIERIERAKELNKDREKKFLIAIDGGVDSANIDELKAAGADVVYSEVAYFDLIKNDKNN